MAWVFQGNPKKFSIDEYLSSFSELIYWYTPTNASEIALGDRAFIWRSGDDAGAVAIGRVVELPIKASAVMHPEALGSDLWSSERPEPNEIKTGIRPDEIRLSTDEGMLSRQIVARDATLARAMIIRRPVGTVFRLTDEETAVLERMWGLEPAFGDGATGVSEGALRLTAHYKRERSAKLRRDKLLSFLKEHGRYFCELCRREPGVSYPDTVGERIYEVHHRKPLAVAREPVRTTLDDLAVLCANCHRLVHASADVDLTYERLRKHFAT